MQSISKIQEQFNRVIQYSQDIDNPKTDKLFADWYTAKKRFIDYMDGELIWQSEAPIVCEMDKEAKVARIENWISELSASNDSVFEKIAVFLTVNQDGFFENKTVAEYSFYNKDEIVTIPAGMRIGKALHRYFDALSDYDTIEGIRNEMSRIIQENKMTGYLCISVHPLDFLSSSENNHNWRSCHALDGDYRAGNLSYMVDNCTIMAYIKSEDNVVLPRFPEDVPWNNKKWRCLFFFDHDNKILYAGRQYPFSTQSMLDIVSRVFVDHQMFSNKFVLDRWRKNVFTEFEANGETFECPRYIQLPGFGLYPLTKIIKDHQDSMHFNDLLRSSYYLPQSYDYYYPTYFGTGRFEKPMIIGGDVKCLCCEERPIGDSDKMMCIGCADGELEEAEDYCGICGEPIWSVDDAVYMEGLYPYCNDCYDALGEDLQECHTCHRPIDTSNPYRSRQAYRDGYWYCGPCEDRRAHLEGIRMYTPVNMPSNDTIFEWDDAQLWESIT